MSAFFIAQITTRSFSLLHVTTATWPWFAGYMCQRGVLLCGLLFLFALHVLLWRSAALCLLPLIGLNIKLVDFTTEQTQPAHPHGSNSLNIFFYIFYYYFVWWDNGCDKYEINGNVYIIKQWQDERWRISYSKNGVVKWWCYHSTSRSKGTPALFTIKRIMLVLTCSTALYKAVEISHLLWIFSSNA